MIKHGIDQEALIKQFSEATAKQGDAIRKAVTEATLKALQGRELTLANIRQVLNTVAKAASTGAASSPLGAVDARGAARARPSPAWTRRSRRRCRPTARRCSRWSTRAPTCARRRSRRRSPTSRRWKTPCSLRCARRPRARRRPLEGPWADVLQATQGKGTDTGALASATVAQLLDSAQKNLRDGRALGLQASQAMLDSYSTLVSGVLIGMSDALSQGSGTAPAATAKK